MRSITPIQLNGAIRAKRRAVCWILSSLMSVFRFYVTCSLVAVLKKSKPPSSCLESTWLLKQCTDHESLRPSGSIVIPDHCCQSFSPIVCQRNRLLSESGSHRSLWRGQKVYRSIKVLGRGVPSSLQRPRGNKALDVGKNHNREGN